MLVIELLKHGHYLANYGFWPLSTISHKTRFWFWGAENSIFPSISIGILAQAVNHSSCEYSLYFSAYCRTALLSIIKCQILPLAKHSKLCNCDFPLSLCNLDRRKKKSMTHSYFAQLVHAARFLHLGLCTIGDFPFLSKHLNIHGIVSQFYFMLSSMKVS